MEKKICLLLMMLLVIVLRSTAQDTHALKGSSALDRKVAAKTDDDAGERSVDEEHELVTPLISRRNRYQGYGSTLDKSRSRSRWSPPTQPNDDSSEVNDWGRPGGLGLNNLLSGLFGQVQQDNAPTCHSILDPQYTLFSDICGVVPQARYSLPNFFGHVERWQIVQTLTTVLGPNNPAAANPGCTRSLKLLICPLLFPPCKSSRRELPPVLPCQPFCRAVKGQCPAPTLDLLPCDFLPPTSELCPANPTPYSSLLSSFGSPFSLGSGMTPSGLPSPLSSLLAQSALSSGLSPLGALSGSPYPLTGFPGAGSFQGQNLGAGAGLSSFFPNGQGAPTQSPFFPNGQASPTQSPFFPTGQAAPTQSPFQNYLSSLSKSQTGPIGGNVAGGQGQVRPASNGFNAAQYTADSLTPVLVDFPPLASVHDMRKAGRLFPSLRSSNEQA